MLTADKNLLYAEAEKPVRVPPVKSRETNVLPDTQPNFVDRPTTTELPEVVSVQKIGAPSSPYERKNNKLSKQGQLFILF